LLRPLGAFPGWRRSEPPIRDEFAFNWIGSWNWVWIKICCRGELIMENKEMVRRLGDLCPNSWSLFTSTKSLIYKNEWCFGSERLIASTEEYHGRENNFEFEAGPSQWFQQCNKWYLE
jgi:hypothetical protein